MEIQTAHFGAVTIDEKRILTFENGLPGFEEEKSFTLIHDEVSHPICWLQSLNCKEVSLPVVDPFMVFPDYSFDISQDDVNALNIERMKDVFVLSVLVIPQTVSAMTINLSAPIIINTQNSRARQIVLDDRRYQVRTPVSKLLKKLTKAGT